MDALRREGEDVLELLDRIVPPLETQVQESTVVEVGDYVHGLGRLGEGDHWVLNDSQRVLVALRLEAELRELTVERTDHFVAIDPGLLPLNLFNRSHQRLDSDDCLASRSRGILARQKQLRVERSKA